MYGQHVQHYLAIYDYPSPLKQRPGVCPTPGDPKIKVVSDPDLHVQGQWVRVRVRAKVRVSGLDKKLNQ